VYGRLGLVVGCELLLLYILWCGLTYVDRYVSERRITVVGVVGLIVLDIVV